MERVLGRKVTRFTENQWKIPARFSRGNPVEIPLRNEGIAFSIEETFLPLRKDFPPKLRGFQKGFYSFDFWRFSLQNVDFSFLKRIFLLIKEDFFSKIVGIFLQIGWIFFPKWRYHPSKMEVLSFKISRLFLKSRNLLTRLETFPFKNWRILFSLKNLFLHIWGIFSPDLKLISERNFLHFGGKISPVEKKNPFKAGRQSSQFEGEIPTI